MPLYENIGGNSNITGYQIGDENIQVMFRNGQVYNYTYDSAGVDNVEQMKQLAQSGSGLNSFILSNVKDDYE
jgi:hypothetical protein